MSFMIFCIHLENDVARGDSAEFEVSLASVPEGQLVWEHLKTEANGERKVCILLDHHVVFMPEFFNEVAKAHSEISANVTYMDHQWVSSINSRIDDIHPPKWSPERFLSVDYFGPVVGIDSDLVDAFLATDFDSKLPNSQDKYDFRSALLLWCMQQNLVIMHLDLTGYSVPSTMWRPKIANRQNQIKEFLNLTRPQSKIATLGTSWNVISNADLSPEKISIIIPTRGAKKNRSRSPMVTECIKSLLGQNFGDSKIEIIVVFDTDVNTSYLAEISHIKKANLEIKFVEYEPPFNFSKKCNIGAALASGEVLLFLNDDTYWMASDSLLELAGSAMLPNVGAVGSKLLFANGRVQHAGYIFRDGFVSHAYIKDSDGIGPFGDLIVTHEVVGVTGACLAQRKNVWEKVGRWDESLPASYNDVDFCFRIRESGLSILQVNKSQILHFESITRNPRIKPEETELILSRWKDSFIAEPYFRMAVQLPEIKFEQSTVIGRYFDYAKITFKRQGLVGVFGLVLNVCRKALKVK
jgi:GT2 family glycosyltransferase